MRSSLTIFVIGFLLGSTLGIGGLYTQVLKPAWQEVEQLEEENGVMESALDEAGSALRNASERLRGDDGPAPLDIRDIFSAPDKNTADAGITTAESDTTRKLDETDRTLLADQLGGLAERLEAARKERRTE